MIFPINPINPTCKFYKSPMKSSEQNERQRFAAETDTGDETRGGSGELEVEDERQRPEVLGWAMFFELL